MSGTEDEIARLCADAGRYRWLRAQHWESSSLGVVRDPKESVKLGYDVPSGDRLDMAIKEGGVMTDLKTITITHWGSKYAVTPYLLFKRFGNGKKFLAISPITLRPLYYVVRIGDKWETDDDKWPDRLDAIWDAIEEEFGTCCEDYGDCECSGWKVWPSVKLYEGCTWRELSDGELKEIGLRKRSRA